MVLVAWRTNEVMKELKLSVSTPDLWGGESRERGWRLNQSQMVNDLINHVYVMKA